MKITGRSKTVLALIGMVALAYVFWDTPVLFPVKLFVVILHEMSHGIAALLCGGRILEIKIDYQIGGSCSFSMPPGIIRNVFVASAGYLGSMLWGALILIIAARTRYDRLVSLIIGLMVLVLALLFVRELFGFVFCIIFSVLMCAVSRFMPDWFNDCLIKFIGMASCLYAIVDIKEDLIDRSGIGSDADAIADIIGIPKLSVVIGVIWIILACLILLYSLKIASYGEKAGKTEKTESDSEEEEQG